jgi:hypothetical protein
MGNAQLLGTIYDLQSMRLEMLRSLLPGENTTARGNVDEG